MSKILIADDEANIRQLIGKYAAIGRYETDQAENGMQAVEKCRTEKYDLVILDIMMPELDGFSAARQIKEENPDIPIIFLSARGEEYDRINGFAAGADDYVVKPFSPQELMLRVNAILKRTGARVKQSDEPRQQQTQPSGQTSRAAAQTEEHDVFDLDGLHVDFTSRIVTVDGKRVELTYLRFGILEFFIRNKDVALSRDMIISHLWRDPFGVDRSLDTHIKLLRQSLGKYGKHVVTLRSMGYRFETEI